jgi:hypothetical protein
MGRCLGSLSNKNVTLPSDGSFLLILIPCIFWRKPVMKLSYRRVIFIISEF